MKLSKLLIPIFCLSLGACSILLDKPQKPIISMIENDFHKTEVTTSYKYKMGENHLDKQILNFSAKKEGAYLIEVWNWAYRSADRLNQRVAYHVEELPFETELNLSTPSSGSIIGVGGGQRAYHVEIIYSDGQEMNVSDLILPTVGYSASELGYSESSN